MKIYPVQSQNYQKSIVTPKQFNQQKVININSNNKISFGAKQASAKATFGVIFGVFAAIGGLAFALYNASESLSTYLFTLACGALGAKVGTVYGKHADKLNQELQKKQKPYEDIKD